MPAPDPVAIPTGIAPGHALLYTLTMPDGRKVSVYGNPDTWKKAAAGMLLDARRILQSAEINHSARRNAAPILTQE